MVLQLVLLLMSVILAKSQTGNEVVTRFIATSSISVLVVSLIVLVFGIGAVIAGVLIFKLVLYRLRRKDGIPDAITEQESNTAPGLHTYELIDSQGRPNNAADTAMPYEIAVSDKHAEPPPVPPVPEEMGFTVTQDIDDDQDGYEDFEPDPARAGKDVLVTPNPFYVRAEDRTSSKTPNYENHELVEYEDLSSKRDLSAATHYPEFSTHDSQSDPLKQNLQLESAINFCDRQDIEGELIDEVDYQNVTVVRTKVKNPHQDSTMHPDLLLQGMATASIQWQGSGTDNTGFDRSYNGGAQQLLPGIHDAADAAEDVYDDVSQMAQDGLYQNFGAEQSNVVRIKEADGLEDEEDFYEDTRLDAETETADIYDGIDDIFMNSEPADNEVDLDYENMAPGKYRQ